MPRQIADGRLLAGERVLRVPAVAQGLEPHRAGVDHQQAADQTFAETYAKEFYGRRGESEALWVVPREAIIEVEDFADELNRNYHRVDGYPLKEKLKEARERAGRALVARDR